MIVDKYGTKLRMGRRVSDMREGRRREGEVIGSRADFETGNARDQVLVAWDTHDDDEWIDAKDLLVVDKMLGMNR